MLINISDKYTYNQLFSIVLLLLGEIVQIYVTEYLYNEVSVFHQV